MAAVTPTCAACGQPIGLCPAVRGPSPDGRGYWMMHRDIRDCCTSNGYKLLVTLIWWGVPKPRIV